MNVRSPRFWLAVISLSAVFGYAAATLTKSSPGELSASHAQDGSLTGAFSCAACHGGWVGDMTSSCLECHEDVGAQIEAGTGLHGVQAPDLARSCQLCHSEHHGPDFRMVNTASFALAGVADVAAFDHGRIGYDMAGKHLELDCTECHELAEAPMLEDGQSRYLGLDQNCASCHDDPHEGRMAIACASCHSQDAWDAWEAPDHDRYLPLQGAHGRLECAACHEPEGDLDLEVLGARAVRAYKQNCLTCHESPHREDALTALGAAERRSLEASCGLCHEPDHESFGDERLADTVTPERHAHTGFRLEEPHAEQTCAECHGDVATGTMQFAADAPFATRYPGREQTACATCHDDVHRGEFDGSPLAPNGCVDCHATTHFDPHAFTAAMHDSTAFALTGTHTTTECRACHERTPDDGPAAFGETPSTCDECHADAHGGYFAPFAAALGARPAGETDAAENAPDPDASDTAAPDAEGNADATRTELANPAGTCAHCHETTHFSDIEQKPFDHGRFTGLPIEGAHEYAGCESCHPRATEPDEFGRRFGRVEDHFGEYVGCVTCHQDPHEGEFDHPECPKQVEGREGCARCHSAVSFRALTQPFDHHKWTGFLLRGAHLDAECQACHAPLATPDPDTRRTWGRANGRSCRDCHEDPHVGQFLYQNGNPVECIRCHRVSDSFADLSFDHEVHSRFKLGPAHSDVRCEQCHVPEEMGDGITAVRYRPIPHECSDCHGSAYSPFGRRR